MYGVRLFLPVKITDKQWAEKLLEGSVFMRSLSEFGAWKIGTAKRAKEMNNNFRGDILEGIMRSVDPKIGDDFFNSFDSEVRKHMMGAFYIDENIQYMKMYCLTHNLNTKEFENPDKRLREFGDTAVIISNPNEFLRRIIQALVDKFGDSVIFDMKEVYYYDLLKDFGDFNIFCKAKQYEWQNELRIAIGLLDPSESIIDHDGQVRKLLVQDLTPLTLEFGSIRDIAVSIPVEDLIDLRLPVEIEVPAV